MSLLIKPTSTVTGKQARKHLKMIESGKSPKYLIDISTPPNTSKAVNEYLKFKEHIKKELIKSMIVPKDLQGKH